jgi:hypothetical protein
MTYTPATIELGPITGTLLIQLDPDQTPIPLGTFDLEFSADTETYTQSVASALRDAANQIDNTIPPTPGT